MHITPVDPAKLDHVGGNLFQEPTEDQRSVVALIDHLPEHHQVVLNAFYFERVESHRAITRRLGGDPNNGTHRQRTKDIHKQALLVLRVLMETPNVSERTCNWRWATCLQPVPVEVSLCRYHTEVMAMKAQGEEFVFDDYYDRKIRMNKLEPTWNYLTPEQANPGRKSRTIPRTGQIEAYEMDDQ